MNHDQWLNGIDIPVTVCNLSGNIRAMNKAAQKVFAEYGGIDLIGESLFDCHNPSSKERIRQMLKNGEKNVYIVDKDGRQTLIYQVAWYKDGQVAGLVEFSLTLPSAIDTLKR